MRTLKRHRSLLLLASWVILAGAGCTIDVGTAARGSLTSFLTTLANSAITSAINQ